MSEFVSNSFVIVFSNSVIEHVGNISNQMKMADEIKRIGKCYFVQIPNYCPLSNHISYLQDFSFYLFIGK